MTGMYDIVCHLIDVHHYSRIAFLSGPPQHSDEKERFAGFTLAMESHGLPIEESLLIEGTFEMDSGSACVREFLDKRGKIAGEDVQAIVCCNDYMAIGVIMELQKRGITIPAQIAVTGFDDLNVSSCLIPPFSTLTAKNDLLIKLIEKKSVPEQVSVRPHFINRHSCSCSDALYQTDTLAKVETPQSFRFPEHINKQILTIGRPILMAWKQALTRLRLRGTLDLLSNSDKLPPQTVIGPEQNVGDSLNHNQSTWELMGRIAYSTFNSVNYQTVVHNMESALTSTMELTEL